MLFDGLSWIFPGLIALVGSIALATGACIVGNGITALSLIEILETKVDSNKTEADKIGGWSSNYSDTVGVWEVIMYYLRVIYW